MKIRLARKIGFCFGVKRAVKMADESLKKDAPIYSLGSIIHNRQVVQDLEKKGLKVIKDPGTVKSGVIVISSHGLSPKIAGSISARGIKVIDTTCPFVLKAQRIAKSLSDEGYSVVIVGDKNHPEVKALVDFVEKSVYVVKDKLEARALKIRPGEKVSMISQTTQSTVNFLDVVKEITGKKPAEMRVFNTICNDAEERQTLARKLAGEVDVMLIIGGKHSANTRRLFEVTKKIRKRTYLVETENELKKEWFRSGRAIGITSGASTPDWIVNRVVERIKRAG